MTPKARFAAGLLRFREANSKTQNAMACTAGVGENTYRAWEHGLNMPCREQQRRELRILFKLTKADLPVAKEGEKTNYIPPKVGHHASHNFPMHRERMRSLEHRAKRELPLTPERNKA